MIKRNLKTIIRRFSSHWLRMQMPTLPDRILAEYRNGRFPMLGDYGFLEWHFPEQRAIVPLDDRFHIGKRLTKKLESHVFEVTFDQACTEVIKKCAETRAGRDDNWLCHELIETYTRLHELGHAHSVEVWHEGKLVGGEYGVAMGAFYSGESMFHLEDYASRVALVYLVQHLRERGFTLLDSQYMNATAREFGAFEVGRDEYKKLLANALAQNASF